MPVREGSERVLTVCANLEVAVGLASIVVGVLLILAPGTLLFAAYNATISTAFWDGQALGESAARMNHWLLATCGAGVVGWGTAWATLAHIPLRAGERWAWLCLLGEPFLVGCPRCRHCPGLWRDR